MDSGNSGSMQSSSGGGGNEEYDSRSESISAFINSSSTVGSASKLPPPSLFDPLSNYLDAFPRSPTPHNMNSLLNLDTVWTRGQQSEPNCTDIGSRLIGSSALSSSISISGTFPVNNSSTSSNVNIGLSTQLPLPSENGIRTTASTDQPNVSRNSKKRSRTSRAPTTVLTTNTSNFRAMVQEFTGIPSPPFTASPFPKARIDLFNSASSLRSGFSNPHLPPYLLRPFAHKVQRQAPIFASRPPSTCSSSATMLDVVSSTTNPTNTNTAYATNVGSASTTATSAHNYQLPCDLDLLKQNPNLLNFSFSFHNPAPKYPFAPVPDFSAKSQGPLTIPSTGSHLKMGLLPLDEFGMNQGHVNAQLGTPANLVTSDAMSLRRNDTPSWADAVGSDYRNSQRVSGCKMNLAGSSSDFHVEKGSENESSRGEGMVDSWIWCTD